MIPQKDKRFSGSVKLPSHSPSQNEGLHAWRCSTCGGGNIYRLAMDGCRSIEEAETRTRNWSRNFPSSTMPFWHQSLSSSRFLVF
ncbi:hypothetical protein OIU76_024525 [Salix suchowensis]|nr:hypothetical protein OIU76_024525 [Salix suchowensis]